MIQLQNVSKAFGMKSLLEDVSLSIHNKEKMGFVAPNGSGKSTLFKLILGMEEADRGTLTITNEEIGYLPQTIDAKPDDTIDTYLHRAIHEPWEEYKIDTALAQVNLKEVDVHLPIIQLSGGQKTKTALANVLIHEPSTLLIDEPTNNLDLESLNWLEKFIRKFKGNVVVISHDRTFLDNTVRKIIELDPLTHKLEEYTGNYTAYKQEKQLRYESRLKTFNRFEKERKEMEEWIAKKKEQLQFHQSVKVARQLEAMKTRYEREFVKNKVDKPVKGKLIHIAGFGEETYAKRVMFFIQDMKFKVIISCEKLAITAGDRIHLKGKNGSGKSTFIKLLLGELNGYTGKVDRADNLQIGYFSQEHDMLNYSETVIENFMKLTHTGNEGSARKVLGKFLFSGDLAYQNVKDISQGERVKLIIAIITHQNNQFLILDEPTNHLDIESREILERALQEYEGGMLVVSHDRYFIDQLDMTKSLEAKDGSVMLDR